MAKRKKRKHGRKKGAKHRRPPRRPGAQAGGAQGQRGKAKAGRQAERPSQKVGGAYARGTRAVAKRKPLTYSHREFLRRSRAAKKGWRRRKAREKIEREAKEKPISKGPLLAWLVTWEYTRAKRQVDFDVIARNENDAKLFVIQAVARGKDSKGADLSWMNQIPWDNVSTEQEPPDESEISKAELKALGEGWVEKR